MEKFVTAAFLCAIGFLVLAVFPGCAYVFSDSLHSKDTKVAGIAAGVFLGLSGLAWVISMAFLPLAERSPSQ